MAFDIVCGACVHGTRRSRSPSPCAMNASPTDNVKRHHPSHFLNALATAYYYAWLKLEERKKQVRNIAVSYFVYENLTRLTHCDT